MNGFGETIMAIFAGIGAALLPAPGNMNTAIFISLIANSKQARRLAASASRICKLIDR
jgi:copper(I)-binding protein